MEAVRRARPAAPAPGQQLVTSAPKSSPLSHARELYCLIASARDRRVPCLVYATTMSASPDTDTSTTFAGPRIYHQRQRSRPRYKGFTSKSDVSLMK
ncbi:hypothetical protein EVAR_48175_1 [Eumeta japonica]|uniref:Uncharacterized protein n=1 Tax=Eumeta variegata TaxID=151549 RepID=A0A4C1XWY5_EUMVA|nr:hypothetical protein EVAR_48175_1 [Eumeta japonica]